MSKGCRRQLKEALLAKGGTIQQQNKIVLEYNPKYKLNIHES